MASKKNLSEKLNVSPVPVDQTFHQLFEQRTVIMLLIEPQTGMILESSAAAEIFYGVPQSKLCGMSIDEINGQPSGQMGLKVQKAKDEGKNHIIIPQRLASGETRVVEILSSPLVWQQKQTLFLIIHDITERTQISDALDHTNMVLQEDARQHDLSLEDLHVYQIELEMQNEELRKAQANLEVARARYFDLYDLAPVGYCTVSEQGLILEANLTAVSLLEVTRVDLPKKAFRRFIHPDQQPAYIQAHRQLFETGETLSLDVQLLKKDGAHFWAHLKATLRPDAPQSSEKDAGRPIIGWIVISDISERKQAEEVLQTAHAVLELRVAERTDELRKEIIERKKAEYQTKERVKELQAFYNLAEIAEKEGITLENLYQELADVLPKSWQYPEIACTRIGMGDREFCTENYTESPWMLSAFIKVNKAVVGSLKVGYLEEKPKEDEGPFLKEERWLIDAIAERIGRITESKQEAEKLQKSEARLKAIFENSDQSFLVIDLNRKIQSFNKIANERTVKTFGKEIRPGDSIYEMVLPRDRDDFDRDFQHALNGDLVQTEKSFNVGAVELCYEFRYAPVRLDGQQVFGVFFSVTDITERKQMEVALRRNQSMLARTERIAQIGSWEWDVATDTVTWSDEMFRLFQRNPADGAPSFAEHQELYFPEDMQRLRDAVEATLNNGAPYEIELRAIRKDGAVWVCLALGFAEMSPEKRATRLFGSLQDITERKQADIALRMSEERYRLLAENIPDIIYSLDSEGNIITINSPAFERYGYSEQDSKGKPFLNFIHPDDQLIVIGSFINALQEQRSFTHGLQFRIVAKDGQDYWFELNSQAHFDSAGGYLGEEGIIRDITKRKHAENALKDEYNFRTAIENSMQAGVAVIDLSGKQISVNQHFSKLVGWTLDELIGISAPFAYWPPDEIENINDAFQQTLQGKAPEAGFELKFLRKNGELIDVSVNLSALEDAKHEIIGWLAVVADITERKLAQEALREAHFQLKGIIEATRAGTWVWNVQTGEGLFNEKWAQMVGYTLDELLPTSITTLERLAHPEDLKHAYELLDRHIAGDLPYYDFEMRMKHKDGHWVWIHDRGRVINRTEDGKPLMMFGTHTDITARKASDEKIQLLNAELEKLVVTDTLTQINNRRYFMMRCAEEFKRETRNSQPLVLLMMDIDHFKKINDAYGHAVGDLVLQQVAAVLKSNLREIDILGRIGGEEFAMLLPATLLEEAVQLAERLRQSVEEMVFETPGNLPIKVTFSIGAAVFEDTMTNIGNLLRNADEAMYQAKHSGRNCVKAYQSMPPGRAPAELGGV